MKFAFPYLTKAKLSSVNVRSEKHGPELVPAVDLKIVVDASNNILSKFHPELKEALYFNAQQEEEAQGELDGAEPVTNLPNLRFPKLDAPLKWDHLGAGYRLDIDFGLGGSSNLVMFGCEINNIGFSCKEGGTVKVSFRVQISNVEEGTIGKLATLCQHEISIVLTPPAVEDVADIMETMESPFTNQAELDAMEDDTPKTESELFPLTPEAAFAAAVDADASVH